MGFSTAIVLSLLFFSALIVFSLEVIFITMTLIEMGFRVILKRFKK